MSRLLATFVAGFMLVTGLVAAQDAIPPELAAMADTEREFARTAKVKGWRDAFLDFFAGDAIAFAPQVMPARDRLRKQPSTPFSEFELLWEPRTGDVAASGDLGWLTGPRNVRDQRAQASERRLHPAVESRHVRPLVAHGRRRTDVLAGSSQLPASRSQPTLPSRSNLRTSEPLRSTCRHPPGCCTS